MENREFCNYALIWCNHANGLGGCIYGDSNCVYGFAPLTVEERDQILIDELMRKEDTHGSLSGQKGSGTDTE